MPTLLCIQRSPRVAALSSDLDNAELLSWQWHFVLTAGRGRDEDGMIGMGWGLEGCGLGGLRMQAELLGLRRCLGLSCAPGGTDNIPVLHPTAQLYPGANAFLEALPILLPPLGPAVTQPALS